MKFTTCDLCECYLCTAFLLFITLDVLPCMCVLILRSSCCVCRVVLFYSVLFGLYCACVLQLCVLLLLENSCTCLCLMQCNFITANDFVKKHLLTCVLCSVTLYRRFCASCKIQTVDHEPKTVHKPVTSNVHFTVYSSHSTVWILQFARSPKTRVTVSDFVKASVSTVSASVFLDLYYALTDF